jgi:hypothetical protein
VDLHRHRRPLHLPLARGDGVKGWHRPGGLRGRRTSLLPSFEMLSSSVGYAPPRLCSFPYWGFDDNGAALAIAFFFAPYFFLMSWSSACSRALASYLRSWEASQCLIAHDGVGVGDDDC